MEIIKEGSVYKGKSLTVLRLDDYITIGWVKICYFEDNGFDLLTYFLNIVI